MTAMLMDDCPICAKLVCTLCYTEAHNPTARILVKLIRQVYLFRVAAMVHRASSPEEMTGEPAADEQHHDSITIKSSEFLY